MVIVLSPIPINVNIYKNKQRARLWRSVKTIFEKKILKNIIYTTFIDVVISVFPRLLIYWFAELTFFTPIRDSIVFLTYTQGVPSLYPISYTFNKNNQMLLKLQGFSWEPPLASLLSLSQYPTWKIMQRQKNICLYYTRTHYKWLKCIN